MDLLYRSTRDSSVRVTASQAVLKGLSADGGLFVPESIPKLDVSLDELAQMSYQETAYAVMSRFLTDLDVYKRQVWEAIWESWQQENGVYPRQTGTLWAVWAMWIRKYTWQARQWLRPVR